MTDRSGIKRTKKKISPFLHETSHPGAMNEEHEIAEMPLMGTASCGRDQNP